MKIILHWLLSAGVLLLIALKLPILGVHVADFKTALIAAAVLGLLNVFLKPILKILTFPINIVTLGLFGIIINGLVFYIAARFVPNFTVINFYYAILVALVYSIANHFIDAIVGTHEERDDL